MTSSNLPERDDMALVSSRICVDGIHGGVKHEIKPQALFFLTFVVVRARDLLEASLMGQDDASPGSGWNARRCCLKRQTLYTTHSFLSLHLKDEMCSLLLLEQTS